MRKLAVSLSFILIFSLICKGQDQPNILVIISDQHASTILSQRGYSHIQTPGIDKIATEGVMFTKSYCAYPVCRPDYLHFLHDYLRLQRQAVGLGQSRLPPHAPRHVARALRAHPGPPLGRILLVRLPRRGALEWGSGPG